MLETQAEIEELQSLFDATIARANPYMLSIVTPEHRLTARQVATYLQGTRHVAFASVTPKGEPRVSPLDSLFIHGHFTMGTDDRAVRVRSLRANPACSATYMEGERIAVVVNGAVEWLGRDHRDYEDIMKTWNAAYPQDSSEWGAGVVFFRIVPSAMWTFASHPEEFRP